VDALWASRARGAGAVWHALRPLRPAAGHAQRMHSDSTAGGVRLRLVAGMVPARHTQEGTMPRLRLIHPQAARTRSAPVGGIRHPAPRAARMREPLEAAGRRPGVVVGMRFPAPVAGGRFPAPTAGRNLPAPTSGFKRPAPTAPLRVPAPANVAIAA
jgi:hypothetical protein